MNLIADSVGEQNVHATTLRLLSNNRFELASIHGKSLVLITDSDQFRGSTEILKAITGGDKLRYEVKYQQSGRSFIFSGVLAIAGNQSTINGNDKSGAIPRRILPVVIPKQFVGPARDLREEFRPYLPGFINWVLDLSDEEMMRLLHDADKPGNALEESAINRLVSTYSSVFWFRECIIVTGNSDDRVQVGDAREEKRDSWLYPNYRAFCDLMELPATPIQKFTKELDEIVLPLLGMRAVELPGRNSAGKFAYGLKLRQEGDTTSEKPF
ncbi:MAG: hypothetical protein HQL50_05190 [Magnetococcales bacterium]|nr:hypothetical protein [Magnetococcales bacterium]